MRSRSLPVLLCLILLAGCGSSGKATTNPTTPAATVPLPPGGFVTFRYPGFSVQLPRAWELTRGTGRLLLASQSGPAVISVWRYRHAEPVPLTHASLEHALHALLAATRLVHPSFRLVRARIAPVAHHGGIELVGYMTLGGTQQQVRSTHLFLDHEEIVVDSYVQPPLFPATDQQTFLPVVYRLRISHRA